VVTEARVPESADTERTESGVAKTMRDVRNRESETEQRAEAEQRKKAMKTQRRETVVLVTR
jgi:hypothetical protein